MNDRKPFEEYCRKEFNFSNFATTVNGFYVEADVNDAWRFWCTALASRPRVVLPERKTKIHKGGGDEYQAYDNGLINGFNDALDAVAHLNEGAVAWPSEIAEGK